jgi:hypothetical protein
VLAAARAGRPATIEVGARDGDQPFVLELQLRAEQGHLEQRRIAAVADQGIRQTMGDRIHRTGDGHPARLKSPTSHVLHRRQHPGFDDADARLKIPCPDHRLSPDC